MTSRWIRSVASALIVLAVAAIAGGCGSSSNGTGASGESKSKASEFIKPGNKGNKYAKFGIEAGEEEREAASEVLEENFQARAKGEWAKQCSSLNAATIKEIEGPNSSGDGSGCAAALKVLATPLSQSAPARANTLTGPIDLLMVNGKRAFALYHGKKGKDYAMPMEKVKGQWKVASLRTRAAPS